MFGKQVRGKKKRGSSVLKEWEYQSATVRKVRGYFGQTVEFELSGKGVARAGAFFLGSGTLGVELSH